MPFAGSGTTSTTRRVAVRGRGLSPPPPSLYDTSISTYEETIVTTATTATMSQQTSSFQNHDSQHHLHHPSSTTSASATTKHSTPRFFPKSHPETLYPKYDPRAYNREELQQQYKPVRSEPVLPTSTKATQRYYRRRGTTNNNTNEDDYPDPEPDVHQLERRRNGPLPVFSINDVASEVALGSSSNNRSPYTQHHSFQTTRDLLHRMEGRRANGATNSSSGNKTAREAVAAAALSRRQRQLHEQQRQFQEQQQQSMQRQSLTSAQPNHARRPLTTSSSSHESDEQRIDRAVRRATRQASLDDDARGENGERVVVDPSARSQHEDEEQDWHRRVEIETPKPARVCELKQMLWDDRESLHQSPAPHPHSSTLSDLHYDRQRLNTHWKKWHGELQQREQQKARSRSLSPRTATKRSGSAAATTASTRSRSPPPTPSSRGTSEVGYATPKPSSRQPKQQQPSSKMFQSRFVQAAQRQHLASPQTPHSQYSSPPPATSPNHSVNLIGSPTTTSNRASRQLRPAGSSTPSDNRENNHRTPTHSRNLRTSTENHHHQTNAAQRPVDVKAPTPVTSSAFTPLATSAASAPAQVSTASQPPPQSSTTISMSEHAASISDLVAKLQRVPRDNPNRALAEIDAIIQQTGGGASSVAASSTATTVEQLVVVATALKEAGGSEGSANRLEDIRANQDPPRATTLEKVARDENGLPSTKSNPENEPIVEDNGLLHDNDHENEQEDEDDIDDDDTSVSSITNPTYGVVGSEHHRPRAAVSSSSKAVGQPRPSALSNYQRPTSLLLRSDVHAPLTSQQPQPQVPSRHRHHRRHHRDRSPPPESIQVGTSKEKKLFYQKLEEGETDLLYQMKMPQGQPNSAEANLHCATELSTGDKAITPVTDMTKENTSSSRGMEWNLLTSTHVSPGAACPCSADGMALITTVQMASEKVSTVVPNPTSCAATSATDLTTNSTELAQKIRRWDEMSEPDFCPNVCLHSRSTEKDDRLTTVVDMICPRDLSPDARRRHHPWDTSMPVSTGRVEVLETSMDNAVGIETQFSMKYEDAVSEASVSIEASSGARRNPLSTSIDEKKESEPIQTDKVQPLGERTGTALEPAAESVKDQSGEKSFGGDVFDVDPKLLLSPDVVWEKASRLSSERQQAYARNLADDFDSAWVSLPSSSFFPGEKTSAKSSLENERESETIITNVKRKEDKLPTNTRRKTESYQKFTAREESVSDASTPPRCLQAEKSEKLDTTPVTTRKEDVDHDATGATNLKASQPADVRKSRGLRKFLKLRQSGRPTSTSQESISTSSPSYLQSSSLDLETAETAPPSRGRSSGTQTSTSPDRLRSHSLDERRVRNPNIAKKFNRLLRVYEEKDDRKLFGHI